jgi:hypothetical protein
MILNDLLLKNKEAILERWFCLIMKTYPTDLSKLLKKERDRFVNPVGFTFSKGIEAIFSELLNDMNREKLSLPLENIVKIRSIQDFSPSQAIGFIFLLKKAIQEVLGSRIQEKQVVEEWLKFQLKIDQMALLAFDVYMKCKEKIYEIRVRESKAEKDRAFRLLERMNLLKEEK